MGCYTRLASLSILATVLVGLLVDHAHDSWHDKDVPLVYSIVFGLIMLLGPGKYSLDGALSNALRHPLVVEIAAAGAAIWDDGRIGWQWGTIGRLRIRRQGSPAS